MAIERYPISAPGFGGGSSFNSGNANIVLSDWSGKKGIRPPRIAQELNGKLRQPDGAGQRLGSRAPSSAAAVGAAAARTRRDDRDGAEYRDIAAEIAADPDAALANPGISASAQKYEPTSPRVCWWTSIPMNGPRPWACRPRPSAGRWRPCSARSLVTTYIKNGQEYDVMLQTRAREPRDRVRTCAVPLCARPATGPLVPLSSVVTTKTCGATRPDRPRTDRQRTMTLSMPT
jgi:multidrug efflux pump